MSHVFVISHRRTLLTRLIDSDVAVVLSKLRRKAERDLERGGEADHIAST